MNFCQNFLIEIGFQRGKVDNTWFLKSMGQHLLIVQIYVDDIIFGATHNDLCDNFLKLMRSEFEMSKMGKLNFFLGLQIKQASNETMIRQQKYVKELIKRFGIELAKPIEPLSHLQPGWLWIMGVHQLRRNPIRA